MGRKLMSAKKHYEISFASLCQQGSLAFLNGDMTNAIQIYTSALLMRPQDADTLSNRGMAYTRVRAFDSAKRDFKEVVKIEGNPSLKTLHRFCKAKWALKEYDEMYSILQKSRRIYVRMKQNSEAKEVFELMETTMRLKMESTTGNYNMQNLLLKQQQIYVCGEYSGPIEIKEVCSEKGLGIVAKSYIKAGEVILGSKAYAMAFPPSSDSYPNGLTRTDITNINFTKINTTIMDMLQANPALKAEILQMYSGPCNRVQIKPGDEIPELDEQDFSQLITEIIRYNGVLTSTNPNPYKMPEQEEIDEYNFNTLGLWFLPSFVNHSCVDVNIELQKFGDFLIIRAARDISEGEELVINYFLPTNPYESRRIELQMSDPTIETIIVICKCRLCELERSEPEEFHERRVEIMNIVKNHANPCDSDQKYDYYKMLESFVQELEEMRPNNPELNFPIFWLCRLIASGNVKIGMLRKAAMFYEKVYNLTQITAMGSERIRMGMQICTCYINLRDDEKAREWTHKFKNDLVLLYDAYNVLPLILKQEEVSASDSARLMWQVLDMERSLDGILSDEDIDEDGHDVRFLNI